MLIKNPETESCIRNTIFNETPTEIPNFREDNIYIHEIIHNN